MKRPLQIEEWPVRALFGFRFVALLAVMGSLLASALLFLKGTLEIIHGMGDFLKTIAQLRVVGAEDRKLILTVIPAVDNYLFATGLLIFSAGIYNLFIGRMGLALEGRVTRQAWLEVESLEDLRMQISEVVIMILFINFFERSFAIALDQSVDLLLLGGGIFLVAIALFITQQRPR